MYTAMSIARAEIVPSITSQDDQMAMTITAQAAIPRRLWVIQERESISPQRLILCPWGKWRRPP